MDSSKGLFADFSPRLRLFLIVLLALFGLLMSLLSLSTFTKLFHPTEALTGLIGGQIFFELFVFILPPILLSILVSKHPFKYFETFNKHDWRKYIIGLAILLLASLFIQLLIIDKDTFVFPASFKWLESSSRQAQAAYDNIIKQLMGVKSVSQVVIVFTMVAILPAIGEELLFRGVLQRNLYEWSKKSWFAILLSGLIFGLMHFEFYNFFALCFMGFVLGWIYDVTKNIWLTIFLHFINNAVSFLTMYFTQQGIAKIKPEQKLPFYIPLCAGIVMFFFMYVLYRTKSQWKAKSEEALTNVDSSIENLR